MTLIIQCTRIGLVLLICVSVHGQTSVSADLKSAIQQQMLRDGEVDQPCLNETTQSADAISISRLNLGMGYEAYQVEGIYPCPHKYWIYSRKRSTYQLLLSLNVGAHRDISRAKTRTNGLLDLISFICSAQGDGCIQAHYKFNRQHYALAKCF